MKVWDATPALYSTPQRETLTYVSSVFYLAATTLLWNAAAFWPWSILTAAFLIGLAIAGVLLAHRDNRARGQP